MFTQPEANAKKYHTQRNNILCVGKASLFTKPEADANKYHMQRKICYVLGRQADNQRHRSYINVSAVKKETIAVQTNSRALQWHQDILKKHTMTEFTYKGVSQGTLNKRKGI